MTIEKLMQIAVYSEAKKNYCVVINEVSIFFDEVKETKTYGVVRFEFFLHKERIARIPINYIYGYKGV